ncbi:hypothetical protein [Phreatobacter stygius]|uniref:Uncharacterized protein n=1 Tax=Phreatobacter stygius TaxID=1940610 RepID=A0A4D7B885_9HYPH|nr:hypothetical protein [Phreatobacter stygius]QCI64322.1 hypothetical protein E8M01_08755 [Phreatobacter stygius]
MIRNVAAGLLAAIAVFAVEAATHDAEARSRRRAVPEVRVSRPSWLVTPKVEFPGNHMTMRPDIRYASDSATGDLAVMSTSMRGAAGADRFWGQPGWTVQWPWPAAFYARD